MLMGEFNVDSSMREETVEQAAEAISYALDFLQRESDAAGMLDVSVLIEQARAKAGEKGLGSI